MESPLFSNISIESLRRKKEALEHELCAPDVMADMQKYRRLTRDHSFFKTLTALFEEYLNVCSEIQGHERLLGESRPGEEEFLELVHAELPVLEERRRKLESDIKIRLLPKDENAGKDVILEVRAGTGGEEAALFGAELLRMYLRYCERQGWKVETLSASDTGIGGLKEGIVSVSGEDAYLKLKNESGTHRVQRVPETEASGRIHTSAVTVAVLPEAEEVDVKIEPQDVRIDVYRSSGHGGQSVNTTDSAVRITHLATGLVVTCQDEKSQLKNKIKAMRILRSRLFDKISRERSDSIANFRKNQVGSGDRSEKIRTYNFPQNRVTDHRIGLTLYNLGAVMEGDLDGLVGPLLEREYAASMEKSNALLDLPQEAR